MQMRRARGNLLARARPARMQQMVDVMVLFTGGRRILQLKRDMTNPVLVVCNVLYIGTNLLIAALIRRVDEYVRGKRLASRRYGPDVDVVDEGDSLHFFNVVAECIGVYVLGRPFEQDVHHGEHQMAAAPQDEQRYQDAQDRIDKDPVKSQERVGGVILGK